MKKSDLNQVSLVHQNCFPRECPTKNISKDWLISNFKAYPRIQFFVALKDKKIVGYVFWTERGGFRPKAVFELEQIGVHSKFRGQKIATKLIKESLKEIKKYLKKRGAILSRILVETRTDNFAQELYKKTLKAKPVTIIKDLYSSDELLMISRFY